LVVKFARYCADSALAQSFNLPQMRRAYQASSPKLFSPAFVPGFFLPGTVLTVLWRARPPVALGRPVGSGSLLDCNHPAAFLAYRARFHNHAKRRNTHG
jgi:hypothetical protein